MDVVLEIHWCRHNPSFVKYDTFKVRSHITVEEAPNESHWLINKMAEGLATEARKKHWMGSLPLLLQWFFKAPRLVASGKAGLLPIR